MMTLVIGGSGSGKSAYAEETALGLLRKKKETLLYLATMRILDAEGQKKANRHRKNRSGKGFLTLEQPLDIIRVLENLKSGEGIVLLECISNLAANEMFAKETPGTKEQVTEKIVREVEALRNHVTHLVVVSNNVFEDGVVYDADTMEYIEAMGGINQRLASMADRVVEVVVGIPVILKEAGGGQFAGP